MNCNSYTEKYTAKCYVHKNTSLGVYTNTRYTPLPCGEVVIVFHHIALTQIQQLMHNYSVKPHILYSITISNHSITLIKYTALWKQTVPGHGSLSTFLDLSMHAYSSSGVFLTASCGHNNQSQQAAWIKSLISFHIANVSSKSRVLIFMVQWKSWLICVCSVS